MPLSTFLNDIVPTQLRGLAWLALSDTGQVGAGSIVSDSGGGGTASWTYGGTIPCRLDPLTGDEGVVGSRLHDRSTHLITVPVGTAVDGEDRFVVAGRGTFEITAVRERTGAALLPLEAAEIS